MFFIYNLLLIILSIALCPVVAVAFLIKPKFKAGFREKIGFYRQKSPKKSIWVHAVSVGEINATEEFIKRIKKEFPEYNLVVTTVTATGQEVANKKLKDTADIISWFPYDFSFSAKAAIKAFDPALVIIAETEIWPGFVNQAHKQNIPLMMVNGRISPKSFKGYRNFSFFFKKVLEKFTLILQQTESDRDRITKIGAPPEIVEVMGNLKFDITQKLDSDSINSLKNSLKVGENRVLIAGSTHQGEDEMILRVYNRLKCEFTDLKLIIAPRHPERNKNVLALIASSGHRYGLRSKKDNFENADIIMLDTMGELGNIYSACYLAFIGGSFSGTGGHNPLEAAIYGVPVVSGDTVFNFKDIYKFMTDSDSAKIVGDERGLYVQLRKYLINDDNYIEAQKSCFEIFEKNRGALDYALEKIKKLNWKK